MKTNTVILDLETYERIKEQNDIFQQWKDDPVNKVIHISYDNYQGTYTVKIYGVSQALSAVQKRVDELEKTIISKNLDISHLKFSKKTQVKPWYKFW